MSVYTQHKHDITENTEQAMYNVAGSTIRAMYFLGSCILLAPVLAVLAVWVIGSGLGWG